MISAESVEAAIASIAGVEGVSFDAVFLVQDVLGVARAFPDEDDFEAAIASTARMLGQIGAGKVGVSGLEDDYEGWKNCHYQHRVAQGAKADMRIMFARDPDGAVRVRGFGQCWLPADFYRRMAELGRPVLDGRPENEAAS